MPEDNLKRMIRLAEAFFETKNDPMQISVDEDTRAKLMKIHESTMTEFRDENGPIAWVLVIPTTITLMQQFVAKTIHERDLLDGTPLDVKYDALYLCSALVLPEHRKEGVARTLAAKAIRSIQRQHPIRYLFYWAFSVEGKHLAESLAREFNLPLQSRSE